MLRVLITALAAHAAARCLFVVAGMVSPALTDFGNSVWMARRLVTDVWNRA